MNKTYNIWKPKGMSSFDVIRYLKNKHDINNKIGHCGTLDPFAEGILIVCVGDDIEKFQKIKKLNKIYEAEIKFGEETDTLDCTGDIIKHKTFDKKITKKIIKNTLDTFIGTYYQTPPYYSAKKINGIRLYSLARKGIFIRLKKNKVNIFNIKLLEYSKSKIKILIECSTGTYIRSLAKDIAFKLNTFGYVESLVRTNIGSINKSNCTTIDGFLND